MEVRIGIRDNGRDLSFESTASAKEISEQITKALASQTPAISLLDAKGRTILVPTSSIAYVEIGAEETRRVGFIA